MHHIFLSYARADGSQYVKKLDAELSKAGLKTWYDKRNIHASQDFSSEIEKGIENAALVAVCVTPDSKRDDGFVRREIHYALSLKKPVLPLRFADIVPHVNISTYEWLDFFSDWNEAFQRLCDLAGNPTTIEKTVHAIPEKEADPFADYLNALYKNIVVYLDKTVFSLISLQSEATPDAVESPTEVQALPMAFWDMALMADASTPSEKANFSNFGDAFKKYEGRVLLLGDPGAGKTTTIMAFARDAVVRRLEDSTQPLPILAPIATWDAKNQTPFMEWVMDTSPVLKNKPINELINSGRALLILDGLDELGSEQVILEKNPETGEPEEKGRFDPRPRFIKLIPQNNQVLVCCRVKDYQEIGEKLALNGAVTLQALNDSQMQAYLSNLPELWEALQKDENLRNVARTLLLLSLFTFAFAGLSDELKQLKNLSEGDLRDMIFATYLQRRYARESRKPHFKNTHTIQDFYNLLGEIAVADVIASRDNLIDTKKLDTEFINLALLLNVLVTGNDGKLRFIHLLLRDHFAYQYAMICLNDTVTSTPAYNVSVAPITLEKIKDKLKSLNQKGIRLNIDSPIGKTWRRWNAVNVLGKLRDRRAVETLIALLKPHEAPSIRHNTIHSLILLQDTRAVEPIMTELENALTNENWRVFATAAYALASLGDRKAIEPLAAALQADVTDKTLAVYAAEALAKFGDERGMGFLIENIRHKDRDVQLNIISTLRNIGTPEALAALETLKPPQKKS